MTPEQEREAFEAWWPSMGQTIGEVAAWQAWQARASLAQPASVPAVQSPAEAHGLAELVALELERIANDPPISGNELAQARVLMAAASLREFGLAGGATNVQPKGPGDLKLNDPAVQRRLAAQWGYVQAPAPAPAPKAPASVIAFMAVNREGEARFTDNPDAARELEGYGWAITPLAQAPAVGAPFLARDVAELLGLGVPELSAALVALGFPQRSQGMTIDPLEALAVLRARPARAPLELGRLPRNVVHQRVLAAIASSREEAKPPVQPIEGEQP